MLGLKNIRYPEHDYRLPGYYFVTINANWKQRLFAGKEKVIKRILVKTVREEPCVLLDTYNIRLNHMHCIIYIKHKSKISLGEIIRRFKARASYVLKEKVWQPNYYEHIIRSEEALGRIREYIRHNARSEQIKKGGYY